MPAAYLSAAMATIGGGKLEPAAYHVYLQKLLQDAGNPTDPLKIMLIEQLAQQHHSAGRMHAKSANATDHAAACAYSAAAVRLTAEFRRSMLALRCYRAPQVVTRSLTLMQETPVQANDGAAHANMLDESGVANKYLDSEPTSKAIGYHDSQTVKLPQPSAGGRRQKEQVEAARADPPRR